MSPLDFMHVVRRRWVSVVVVVLLALGGVWAACLAATPLYTSSASVYFSLPYGADANDLSQGSTYTQAQMQSYADLATSPVVLEPAAESVGGGLSPEALAGKVSATSSPETVILQISATDPSPERAADISNAVASQLRVSARALSPKAQDNRPTVEVSTIGEASVPTFPSSPQTTRNLAAALVAGIVLGVGVALLREQIDNRVRQVADVARATALPVIGSIERSRVFTRSHLVVRDFARSPTAEGFRMLRSSIDFLAVGHRPVRIVITSSVPGEGKSTTAVNVAHACAEAGQSVLLIDADLRKPSVAEYLGLEGAAGLTTVLAGHADLRDVIQPVGVDAGFDVLTSGLLPPNPSEILGSQPMHDLLEALDDDYDVVIFDAPPLLPVTDAAVLARFAIGAVVVAGLGEVRIPQLRQALHQLEQAGATALGIVATRTPPQRARAYYGTVSADEETLPVLGVADLAGGRRPASTANEAVPLRRIGGPRR